MGYFKPLRRKIGVVTLVIAFAGMGLWVRSQWFNDTLVINLARDTYKISILPFGVGILQLHEEAETADSSNNRRSLHAIEWESARYVPGNDIESAFIDALRARSVNGFGSIGERGELESWRLTIVRFWLLVTPLTLLSAWLLLSKIRNPKPQAEPVPSKA